LLLFFISRFEGKRERRREGEREKERRRRDKRESERKKREKKLECFFPPFSFLFLRNVEYKTKSDVCKEKKET